MLHGSRGGISACLPLEARRTGRRPRRAQRMVHREDQRPSQLLVARPSPGVQAVQGRCQMVSVIVGEGEAAEVVDKQVVRIEAVVS